MTTPRRRDTGISSELADRLYDVAQYPFASSAEIQALAGRADLSNVHRNVLSLRDGALVDGVSYHPSGGGRAYARHFLASGGVPILNERQRWPERRTLRELPVSSEWQEILLGRMDILALVYRIAVQVALCGPADSAVGVLFPRDDPLDGIVTCADGRWFGVMRQGYGLSHSGFGTRLFEQGGKGLQPSTLLVVTSDVLAKPPLVRQLLQRSANLTAAVAVEDEVLGTDADRSVWTAPGHRDDDRIRLTDIVKGARGLRDYRPSIKMEYSRASRPAPLSYFPGAVFARLTEGQRRTFDDVFLWPLMDIRQLAMLRCVPYTSASRILNRLRELGLVEGIKVRDLPRVRFALSDEGLRHMARRDRTTQKTLLGLWNPGLKDEPTGTMLAKLKSEWLHTDGVNDFASRLMAERGRDTLVMPSHRGMRQFTYDYGSSSVSPDLIAELHGRFPSQTVFLEYEMRASSIGQIKDKILPWLRYFSTNRPHEDFQGSLKVLFVLSDDRVETSFQEIAGDLLSRTEVDIPLATTHKELLRQEGPVLAEPVWKPLGSLSAGRTAATTSS